MGASALDEQAGIVTGAPWGIGRPDETFDAQKVEDVISAPKARWPKLSPLEGVKSKNRAILWLKQHGAEGETEIGSLSLSSRVALHGVSAEEATGLVQALCREAPAHDLAAKDAGYPWLVQLHDSAQVMVLPQVEDPCSALAAHMPHVLLLPASCVKPGSAASAALATFPGALLVLADGAAQDLLDQLGVCEQWHSLAQQASIDARLNLNLKLEESPVEDHQGPTFLHDVKLRAPSSPQHYAKPWMEELLEEQFAPLYAEEFGADLGNLCQSQRGYGIKLSLMVQESKADEVPELLGFLAYKPWGLPKPGVSICAVGVPSKFRGRGFGRVLMQVAEDDAAQIGETDAPGAVRFRSLATAVGFYTRLGYQRTEEEEPAAEQDEDVDPEDLPCVPMEKVCGPVNPCGSHFPLQPWSPRRSRHLEDGPTWLPVEAFLLPAEAAVA